MYTSVSTLLALAGALPLAAGQVVGKPFGFATGVTGGGNAAPAVPSNIAQLKSWLADDTPRVIKIDKTFNFIGSEGTVTEPGCRLNTGTCTGANGGQDTIKLAGCDANEVRVTVTYDKASYLGMDVGSNKSLVGVGNKGVLHGKGLRFKAGAKNVIIQNIHIDNLNPKYVWGGDGISLNNNDGVWIDHVKVSRTGRQHFVSHYEPSRVTISHTEFDGVTPNSHTCNNDHYWGLIIGGTNDRVTLYANWLHDISGRGPKIGSSSGIQTVQAVSNYFSSGTGHNFDISSSGRVLIEGNVFENCNTPLTTASNGQIYNTPSYTNEAHCSSYLGRNCEMNLLTNSKWSSKLDDGALSAFTSQKQYLVTPLEVTTVASSVRANAGIGKIGN